MKVTNIKDEYLEKLWYTEEGGERTLAEYKKRLGEVYDETVLGQLEADGLISLDQAQQYVYFTLAGKTQARLLIRSHRLAERLIHDVLGGDFESGACEFEHITHRGMVDAICTLLGHPRECPHGLAIPGGDCCRKSADMIKRSVLPLVELGIGQAARIAYVYNRDDQLLHIMEGLEIKPGVMIRLHQKYPTLVVEVEGASIALDKDVAGQIQVWNEQCEFDTLNEKKQDPKHERQEKKQHGKKH